MDIIINKEQKEKQQTINLSGDKNIVEESSKSIDTLSQQFTVTEFSNAYKIKEVSEVLPSYNPKSFFEQIYLYKNLSRYFMYVNIENLWKKIPLGNNENLYKDFVAGEVITAGKPVSICDGNEFASVSQAVSATNTQAETFGQTFVATSKFIKGVSVLMTVDNFKDQFEIQIRETFNDLPTTVVLATAINAPTFDNATDFVRTDFSEPLIVEKGTKYAIVIKWSPTALSAFNIQNTNVYADGRYCSSADGGTVWSGNSNADIAFYIHSGGVSGKAYISDAGDEPSLRTGFIGFSNESSAKGGTFEATISGIVSGLSSLTIGSIYYLNANGVIGTTNGGYTTKRVGRSISSTELNIIHNFD